ncbi:tumor necrosis factor receptor superfamily member 5-like [Stegostoma tigrinum]|uniref:tumor necrosis factor receptor superfamily member 5-like n=1 Tax=Stegostoma tigrinum TaxID=3053191 RepID=UPI00202B781F|nr:tumor necrosis factor receptor superfamily member 5-like [Stegostoma tigrinum]
MLRPIILVCYFLCLFQGFQLVSGISCKTRSRYLKLNKCCSKCPPGTYMNSECTETKDSECYNCGPDRYQSEWNTLDHCQLHKTCNRNGGFVVEKQGTNTADTICQCQLGMYCINKDCEICEENKVCGPGYGVVYRQDGGISMPMCERCEPGYFSNVSSNMAPCRKWNDCGSLPIQENGTATKDVKCGTSGLPSKAGLFTVIVLLSILLVIIILLSFICIGSNKEHRTKIRDIVNRLCRHNMSKPVQEHVKTENGRILATAGDEDKSPEDGTELLPV